MIDLDITRMTDAEIVLAVRQMITTPVNAEARALASWARMYLTESLLKLKDEQLKREREVGGTGSYIETKTLFEGR